VGLDNPLHIFFLLVILLLVFGAKRLPELGRSLGTGMRGFKESISGEGSPVGHLEEAPAPTATPAVAAQTAEPVIGPNPLKPAA
jgi:sec-independent protein translocase protein TatA